MAKDGIKMTLYNCRDPFMTLQAMQDNLATVIARWADNSCKVMEVRYIDRTKLGHLGPNNI